MTTRHFCTYFDQNYALKGVALLESLRAQAGACTVWVLCLDEVTQALVDGLDWPEVHPIDLDELEAWEPHLPAARADRTLVEYFWTCTPTLIAYVLSQLAAGELVTYVDADLFFYASLEPIYAELGQCSILIHGHRYAAENAYMAADSGVYNVGLVAFRADERGWAALRWWQAACLAACYLRPEEGFCGDQKYLDDWPERFEGVHVLAHTGAGLAPWNSTQYHYEKRQGHLHVDGQPLIFHHFHGFQIVSQYLFNQRNYVPPWALRASVYQVYIHALQEALARLRLRQPDFRAGLLGRLPLWKLVREALYGRLFWRFSRHA
jgi:hypothetical protein